MKESLSIPAMHREHLLKALNTSCCINRAAYRLGVTPRTVYRWRRLHGLQWNPKTRKWFSIGKALPVLSLLICFSSCYHGSHLEKSQVWNRMWAAPKYACRTDSTLYPTTKK